MPIVGGLDIHRKQITFDCSGTGTGQVQRGQISPADREHLRAWLARFHGRDDVAFAVEGGTGWRYVADELAAAGVAAHLAEPADTAFARSRKRHAKTDKTDCRHLRMLLAEGRLPEGLHRLTLRPPAPPGTVKEPLTLTVPPPKPDKVSRSALAARLTALRVAAGLSGNALAKRMGIIQSRQRKIEHGELLPTEEDIQAWVRATGERQEVAAELIDLLAEARVEYQTFKAAYRKGGGGAAYQEQVRAIEERSTRIGEFQVAMIPAILQTADYAREILSLPSGPAAWGSDRADMEAMIDGRLRRQEILHDPHKRIQVVLGEAALRTLVHSGDARRAAEQAPVCDPAASPRVGHNRLLSADARVPVHGRMLVQTPGNAGAISEPNTANYIQRWSTLTVQVCGGAAASGAVHRASCLNLGEMVEALAGKADISCRYYPVRHKA